MRRQLTLTPVGRPIVPDKVTWLAAEMLKTRVAHGYCPRHQSQGACPYANICETCDNYTPAGEFTPSPNNSPTSPHYRPTPNNAAGPAKQNDTDTSLRQCKDISIGSARGELRRLLLTPGTKAG